MLYKKYVYLLLPGLLFAGCNTEPNNQLPASNSDKELEGRVGELEKEVADQNTEGEHQDHGLRLTQKAVGDVNTYLSKLYSNINSTRAQDLPEWQDMYSVLTDKGVMNNPDHGLGDDRQAALRCLGGLCRKAGLVAKESVGTSIAYFSAAPRPRQPDADMLAVGLIVQRFSTEPVWRYIEPRLLKAQ